MIEIVARFNPISYEKPSIKRTAYWFYCIANKKTTYFSKIILLKMVLKILLQVAPGLLLPVHLN